MDRVGYILASFIYRAGNLSLRFFSSIFYRRLKKPVRTILIHRTGNLGDTFCAIPAIQALSGKFPAARLILLTSVAEGASSHPPDVLEGIVDFDRCLIFKTSRLKEFSYRKDLIRKLRSEKVDLLAYFGFGVSFLRIFRDLLFYRLAGCRSAVGFRWFRHGFFRKAQLKHGRFANEVDRLMESLRPLGIKSEEIGWEIPRPARPVVFHSADGPVIAVHPGAKFNVKKWPPRRFAEVIRTLEWQPEPLVIVIGGPGMEKEAEIVREAKPTGVINLQGRTDYLQLADLLSRCDLLLSADSGPVHVAAAVGTPVVALFGGRDYPGFWYPHGDRHLIIRADVECQPCFLNDCPRVKCMEAITVAEVTRACRRLLKKAKPRTRP